MHFHALVEPSTKPRLVLGFRAKPGRANSPLHKGLTLKLYPKSKKLPGQVHKVRLSQQIYENIFKKSQPTHQPLICNVLSTRKCIFYGNHSLHSVQSIVFWWGNMAWQLGGRWVWPLQSKYGHAHLTQTAEARICGRFSKMRLLGANCRLSSMWNRGAGLEICAGFMRNLPSHGQQVLHYWGQHRRKDWKRTLWKLNLKKPNSCFVRF